MGKKSKGGPWKGIAILGGIVGIFSILAFFIDQSLGAWWQFTFEAANWPFSDDQVYLSGFGNIMDENVDEEDRLPLGYLGILAGILMILGSVLVILGAFKESKGIAVLSSILMIASLGLFIYAISGWTDFEDLLGNVSWWTGEEYNNFFGSVEMNYVGVWSWRLGNGFFIGTAGAVVALIGAIQID